MLTGHIDLLFIRDNLHLYSFLTKEMTFEICVDSLTSMSIYFVFIWLCLSRAWFTGEFFFSFYFHWVLCVRVKSIFVSHFAGCGRPTPLYNTLILSDLTTENSGRLVSETLRDAAGVRDGVLLLKVWLHQRQLDVVSFPRRSGDWFTSDRFARNTRRPAKSENRVSAGVVLPRSG